MKKRDYKNILILLLIGISVILGIFLCGNIFGANMDFINQHTTIPEYFRQYFYEYKKLIPDIIYNLGLGENAFNFSYYGLLNPIILISYLLPFISMTNYVMISSIILYLLSIFLCYKWIRNNFDLKKSFILTLIFLTASPVLFHFHRQIMFVNYLPFLLLSLINIDRLENTKHKILLPINIFLMVMTSYYFSVGGIIVIFIYYIYKNFNKTLKEKLFILIPIIIGVLLSSILLVPTLYSLLGNRMSINETINIFTLLIPTFNYDKVLYGSYSLGLFAITIISLLGLLLNKEKKNKFLSITLFILISFPIIRFLLNGGLYIRSKVLIPFLPLFIFSIGIFLKDLFKGNIDYKKLYMGILVLMLLGFYNFNLAYYIDLIITTILIFVYSKTKKQYIIIVPLTILSLVNIVVSNINEEYITYNEYNNLYKNEESIQEVLDKDTSIYRFSNMNETLYNVNRNIRGEYKASVYSSTVNNNYSNFYYNVLKMNNNNYNNLIIRDSSNIILNKLLGVKYIYSEEELGYGYEFIGDNIYENKYALSIGYATSNIYSLDKFSETIYPYNLKYLLGGVVVDNDSTLETEDVIEQIDFDIETLTDYLDLKKEDDYYYIDIKEDKSFNIDVNNLEDKLLFIEISGLEENSCSNDDISIKINGIENSLSCSTWIYNNHNNTFNYLINEKDLSNLEINITKGHYKITDINVYTMDKKYLDSDFDMMTNIEIHENVMSGNIDVTNDGYMVLSIPYEENFKVYVDNELISYEKVNTAFIGFKVNSGSHNIRLEYYAPGKNSGIILTVIGILSYISYTMVYTKSLKKRAL